MPKQTEEFELSLDHLPLQKPSQMNKPELIVLYGPPGGGKTHLAASASEVEGLYPILIIDTEGSASGTVAGFDDDRVDILPVTSHGQLDSLLDALTEKTHKYKTVIIDTFDVAQARAVDEFLEEHASNTFAAWSEIKAWTVDVARTLKAADFLAILVFHENVEKTDTGAMVSQLVLQGSAKSVMPGIPDVVGLVTRKADKEGVETTTVQFAPDNNKATKNRFNLPARVEDPSIGTIFEHIKNRKKGGSK